MGERQHGRLAKSRFFFLLGLVAFELAAAFSPAFGQGLQQDSGPIKGWLAIGAAGNTFQKCGAKEVVALWPPETADLLIQRAENERKLYRSGSKQYIFAIVNLAYLRVRPRDPCLGGLHGVFRCASLEAPSLPLAKFDGQMCGVP